MNYCPNSEDSMKIVRFRGDFSHRFVFFLQWINRCVSTAPSSFHCISFFCCCRNIGVVYTAYRTQTHTVAQNTHAYMHTHTHKSTDKYTFVSQTMPRAQHILFIRRFPFTHLPTLPIKNRTLVMVHGKKPVCSTRKAIFC